MIKARFKHYWCIFQSYFNSPYAQPLSSLLPKPVIPASPKLHKPLTQHLTQYLAKYLLILLSHLWPTIDGSLDSTLDKTFDCLSFITTLDHPWWPMITFYHPSSPLTCHSKVELQHFSCQYDFILSILDFRLNLELLCNLNVIPSFILSKTVVVLFL